MRAVALVTLVLIGCSRATPTPDPDTTTKTKPTPSATTTTTTTNKLGPKNEIEGSGGVRPPAIDDNTPLMLARGVRFIRPALGSDVAEIVKAEQAKAAMDGRDLIVYVGATWCEPCQRFHKAAEAGELDGEFPELSILQF